MCPVWLRVASCLERYTSLESLTLFLHKYHAFTARWATLPLVLNSLPPPRLLRSLTLQLQLERLRSPNDVSDTVVHAGRLEEADRILFTWMTEPDSDFHPFDKLQEVHLVVRTSYLPSEETQDSFRAFIQRLLWRAHACGKLSVTFQT